LQKDWNKFLETHNPS